MAVLEAVRDILGSDKISVPKDVEARMKRGREAMKEDAPMRRVCLEFARGKQYAYLDSENKVVHQPTNTAAYGESGKKKHRVRATRNFIFDIVETEVAAAMQRIPGYEVAPSGTEPRRIAAARLSRKVLLYGYEKWGTDAALEQAVRYAIVADEGFVWPYFDNSIGPFIQDEDGKLVGQGDIRFRVYGPNQVSWEPGLKFEESPWLCIEQAMEPSAVAAMEGYVGGKLEPDARNAEAEVEFSAKAELVMVRDYLERPSKANPKGRWITIANDRVVVGERPYPCANGEGQVLDEPVLHKLTYAMDPEKDRDSGLVRHLLDSQRQLNHSVSKTSEWVNLALNPQLLLKNVKLQGRLNDEPGAVFNIRGSGEAQWRPVPAIPAELFRLKDEAIQDMARIAAQNDIPAQVESGRGIQALLEKDKERRANFLKNLAKFDARLGRHSLYLVQRHYTEPRLLKVKGERGIEPIKDFEGSELMDETDVRVSPDSLEPRTREGVEKKIFAFAERGWISPHAAMAAINNGTAENLIDSYERDVARANLIIQKITEGPEVLFSSPPRRPFGDEDPGQQTDEQGNLLWVREPSEGEPELDEEGQPVPPDPGQPLLNEYVPGWMPRPFDNVKVQKDVFADWMKSTEYDDLPQPSQEAANTYYSALLGIEAKQAAQAAMAQEETAQSLGMNNAARPKSPPPLPDQKQPFEQA
jgi:hypothetical protein